MPCTCRVCSTNARHWRWTRQQAQTALALSACSRDSPLDETGKNSSGSMDRQAASSRQGVGYLCGKGVLGVQMNSEQPLRPPGLRGLGILGPDVDEVDVQLINLGQELGKRLSSDSRRRQS